MILDKEYPLRVNVRYALVSHEKNSFGLSLPLINSQYKNQVQSALRKALEQREIGEIAWADLPNENGIVDLCIEYGKTIRSYFKHFVQVGIGGSALGAQALMEALVQQLDLNQLQLTYHILDNIDPDVMVGLKDQIDLKKTVFHIVTKSGSTPETMAQLFILIDWVKTEVGENWRNHFFITTDPRIGALKQWAVKENLPTLHIPTKVGGRFSVLTSVGLLIASVFNVNVYDLLKGADLMEKQCWSDDFENNPAMNLAVMLIRLQQERAINQLVMMPYSSRLYRLGDWFRQLWAESIGKKYNDSGSEVFTGSTPIKALGATDQHSQVQLYVEGPADKVVIFVVAPFEHQVNIPKAFEGAENLNYLEGVDLGELLHTEFVATQIALYDSNRPSITLELSAHNSISVGAFFYFWEMVTMYAGYILAINPFDQPGVEAGKISTAALLGKQGLEQTRDKVIQTLKSNKPYYL